MKNLRVLGLGLVLLSSCVSVASVTEEVNCFLGTEGTGHTFPAAAYPFGQVTLTAKDLPVKVRVKAFNPFVPGDSEASSLPVMALAYEVENLTDAPVEAAVCGKMRNFIGCSACPTNVDWRGESAVYAGFHGTNAVFAANGLKGVKMLPKDVDSCATGWGTFALTTDDGEDVSARTSFGRSPWYRPTVEIMDDFGADGRLDLPSPEPGRERNPMLALAVKKTVPAKGKAVFPFYLTWSFPNRRVWQQDDLHFVGNHYAVRYRDAGQTAEEIVPRIPELERRTAAFVSAFLSSSAPVELTLPDNWQGELPGEGGNWYGALIDMEKFVVPLAVKNVTFQQRYPWNGKVDIGFGVTGPAGETNVVITAYTNGTVKIASYVAAVTIPASGVLATNLVWDASGLGDDFRSDDVTIEVAVDATVVSAKSETGTVDLRTNAVLRVVVSRQDLLPVAANDSVLWPIGGLMDADKCYAVLSYAPMASKDAEPDETQRVELPQIHGETTETIKLTGGYWQLKLSFQSYKNNVWSETSTLTRVIYYRDGGMVILVK